MQNEIILQGTTLDDLFSKLREIIREEIKNEREVIEYNKAEACRRLGISFPTLQKRLKRENIEVITNINIEKLKSK